jgi:hypothetical protein
MQGNVGNIDVGFIFAIDYCGDRKRMFAEVAY